MASNEYQLDARRLGFASAKMVRGQKTKSVSAGKLADASHSFLGSKGGVAALRGITSLAMWYEPTIASGPRERVLRNKREKEYITYLQIEE